VKDSSLVGGSEAEVAWPHENDDSTTEDDTILSHAGKLHDLLFAHSNHGFRFSIIMMKEIRNGKILDIEVDR
jgi:hypothetical protein